MPMREAVRQWMFPEEFRIGEIPWPDDLAKQVEKIVAQVAQARDELTQTAAAIAPSHEKTGAQSPAQGSSASFLVTMGTGLWRLRQRLVDAETGRPTDVTRRAYRHFESIWDTLSQEGVAILDHTGEDYIYGKSIKVLTFQPVAGLTRERIIETVRPTIYVGDQLAQMGEVIVGKPENT